MKKFLFGNIQIEFKSQGLLYKVLCTELGTPHKTQSYLHYQTNIIIWDWERERERERERDREERDWWNLVYKPVLRISPLLYVVLAVCASLFCSLCLFYVCICSLFLYQPFFSSLRPPFFYLCVPLSIYREIPKKLFLALLSTDQIMEQFLSVFSCTTPNFMFSRDPLFSLFLFSLFRYFLNSFFLVRDSPLSPNRVPHFLEMISLYSLFSPPSLIFFTLFS